VPPELLLRNLLATSGLNRWPRFVRSRLGFRLLRPRLEIGLPTLDFVERGIGKLWLQRSGVVLPLPFRLLFAPLAAVAHPSAHVALVTRPPSSEQLARSSFTKL